MNLLIQTLAAFIVTFSAGILVEAPKGLLYKTGFCGAVGYLIYLLSLNRFSQVAATLIASMIIAGTGQIFARIFKAPVTIFYIPSFFTLVPGTAIYQTAFYFLQGNSEKMEYYFTQTLLIAGAIALGVFIVDSLLEIYSNVKKKVRSSDSY